MSKIAYDQPVVDLRAEVSATGHVTHTAYRKTSVTLHHNAGINTLEQVVNTWKTREASTQFGVDKTGRVGQFTEVTDYAWAVGNTQGNMSSISIEMSNSELAPNWTVGEVTWKAAARLAGWLFAKVIGVRPTSGNLFYHHHWYATACAGPYMDKIYGQVLAAAQASYDHFTAAKPTTPTPSRKSNTQLAAEVWTGKWGTGEERVQKLTAAGYDAKAVQALVDKGVGKPATATTRKSVQQLATEVLAGKWGNGADRQRQLKAAGYSYVAVQAEVDRRLGGRKSNAEIAMEVIAGKWGNGEDRVNRLRNAGYDPAAVQAEVNRRV